MPRHPKYKQQRIAFVNTIKEEHGCTVCGERDPVVLDMHHLDPNQKDETISKLVCYTLAWARLYAELEKCIVLCKNCHAKVHADRFQLLPNVIGIAVAPYIARRKNEWKL